MRANPLLFGAFILLLVSCHASRKVKAPPVIPPTSEAALSDLVGLVNARQSVDTLVFRCGLQFEIGVDAEAGVLQRYRIAEGRILLSRPQERSAM
jgi:hypothetical protein